MPTDNDATRDDNDRKFQWQLEIYKQLHETCRHHYRLEWQLLQVGVIAAIGVLYFTLSELALFQKSGNLA